LVESIPKMNYLFTIYILLAFGSTSLLAQTTISGELTDSQNQPIVGANIFLKGTYEGATTDTVGFYRLNTRLNGPQTLVFSYLGYETQEQPIELNGQSILRNATMKVSINRIEEVVITAGAFEASDEKKSIILKPMDIVTTAGATADIAGTINTLPGTQVVGESGRLFVRGGNDFESRTYIDGLQVNNEYQSSLPNVPSRHRFSPFMFSGTIFSTGGYSAEYGQALSSALVLNTKNEFLQNRTDIGLMSVGLDAAHTQVWEASSLAVKAEYTNLAPYQGLVKQDFDWVKAPENFLGVLAYRTNVGKHGRLKVYGTGSTSDLILNQSNINTGEVDRIDLKNRYWYINSNYKGLIKGQWTVFGGFSFTSNKDIILPNTQQLTDKQSSLHLKAMVTNEVHQSLSLKMGTEYIYNQNQFRFNPETSEEYISTLRGHLPTFFAEADIIISDKLLTRVGVRAEHSSLQEQYTIAPRLSLALGLNNGSQVSAAYGQFYQSPQFEWLRDHKNLNSEEAQHYIVNYQYVNKHQTFRIEAFHKEYSSLVKFQGPENQQTISNQGEGYARGVELFWRDQKTIKNVDYWISYSFLDTERDYLDFPQLATPKFFSKHHASIVYKHFISSLRSQIGWSYLFASGRAYHNPNLPGFNRQRTPAYHNFSVNLSFLWKSNVIVHASASNVFGFDQTYGYEYSSQPDDQGIYTGRPIKPGADRFLFLGIFITLTKENILNQLRNL